MFIFSWMKKRTKKITTDYKILRKCYRTKPTGFGPDDARMTTDEKELAALKQLFIPYPYCFLDFQGFYSRSGALLTIKI